MNYIFSYLHSSFSLLKLFVLGIIIVYSIPLHAQEIVNDSIAQKESSTKELLQQDLSYISLGFIGSGLIIKQQKKDYRELRHNFIPQYRKTWDDYTQYVPLLSTWALKASGVEGRSTWGGLVVSNALSFGIMATITNGLKYTIREQRPDETSRNSFPSGHTACAFAAATILHKEYGLTRSPLYSIVGYSIATATGVGRVLNNRHWVSDVLVGAGIGIVSADIGYFLSDIILKDKGIKRKPIKFSNFDITTRPSFLNIGIEVCNSPSTVSLENSQNANQNTLFIDKVEENKDVSTPSNIRFYLGTGSAVRVEGAYFFNKYIGVGGSLRAISVPTTTKVDFSNSAKYHYNEKLNMLNSLQRNVEFIGVESGHANIFEYKGGVYFSYPLTSRIRLGANVSVGQRFMADFSANAILKVNTSNLKTGALQTPISTTSFFQTQSSKDAFLHQLNDIHNNNDNYRYNFIVIKANPAMVMGSGLSCSWAHSTNMAFRVMLNYDHSISHYRYIINDRWRTDVVGKIEKVTTYYQSKMKIGTFSLGLGMSLLF